jgi:L-threonylcarbamoyladenylate synthase
VRYVYAVSAPRQLAQALAEGAVIGFPTETVYGVGASIRRPDGIARVFEIKSRPSTRALIVHVADASALDVFARDVPSWARRAAQAFWPGPLSVVVPAAPLVPAVAIAGGTTVGIRAVDHPDTLALLTALSEIEGGPAGIAGTSANVHGEVPATRPEHVRAGLGTRASQLAGVLDGGACTVGIESTVVADDSGRPRVLRPGGVGMESLAEATGVEVLFSAEPPFEVESVRWLLGSVTPSARSLRANDLVYSTSERPSDVPPGVRWVVVPEDLSTRSRELFTRLRDIPAERRVWIERAPNHGLGPAINARLDRWARSRA